MLALTQQVASSAVVHILVSLIFRCTALIRSSVHRLDHRYLQHFAALNFLSRMLAPHRDIRHGGVSVLRYLIKKLLVNGELLSYLQELGSVIGTRRAVKSQSVSQTDFNAPRIYELDRATCVQRADKLSPIA